MQNKAIFTIIQNETYFLKLWMQYYIKYFIPSEIYILNHQSSCKETIDLLESYRIKGCNIINLYNDTSFNHQWLNDIVNSFQRFLLLNYKNIVFAEIDEILVADPSIYKDGLLGVINHDLSHKRAHGYNLTHYLEEELPFTFDCDPILYQRKYWHRIGIYDKTLILKEPVLWNIGFHTINAEVQPIQLPGLQLLHLHKFDYHTCKTRHKEQANRNWNHEDLTKNRGYQNRIYEEPAFRSWFYSEWGPRLEMPDYIRSCI